jgi:DNA invertase Pin-like site-specific DNA recombinase
MKILKIDRKKEFQFKRLRVAAYTRVSSDKETMLHSLAAQVSYYSSLIQRTPTWEYKGVYADEGITGTKANRPEFKRLLSDCLAGKIDMIITKSVSRFARNTVTLLSAVRKLKELNIDIYFEEQNIHTKSSEGELLLTLLASVAQEESKSVSDNCKWRVRKSFSEGIMPSLTILGYRRQKDGSLIIVEEEAKIVRQIYDSYLHGLGKRTIARKLTKEGIPTRMGKLWTEHGIDYILRNEKYTGELLLQKEYVADHLSKKKLPNNGVYPMYRVEDNHPPIIDMATFKTVQELLNKPQTKITRKTYPFTGMLICGSCGKHYIRKKTHKGYTWTCGLTERFDKAACLESKNVPEDILFGVTAKALGLQSFNAEIFAKKVAYITARAPNILEFHFKDNKEKILTWEHKSRKDSWTEEMKLIAKETGRKGGLTRWKRK